MMIPLQQVEEICLHEGGTQQCRYLGFNETSQNWTCLKLESVQKKIVDNAIERLLERTDKEGISVIQFGFAMGDNCPGFGRRGSILEGT